MRRKALRNDLAMPVGDGDFFRMLDETVPERLNVFELLVRRELIEAGRRKRWLRHIESIRARGRNRLDRCLQVLTMLPSSWRERNGMAD